jgi:DNA-binding phage protein
MVEGFLGWPCMAQTFKTSKSKISNILDKIFNTKNDNKKLLIHALEMLQTFLKN